VAEIARVLKPGGRVQIADIVIGEILPDSACGTSISGPVELPVLCWKQSSSACSRPLDSVTSRSPSGSIVLLGHQRIARRGDTEWSASIFRRFD
jgi:hypothetical protein